MDNMTFVHTRSNAQGEIESLSDVTVAFQATENSPKVVYEPKSLEIAQRLARYAVNEDKDAGVLAKTFLDRDLLRKIS